MSDDASAGFNLLHEPWIPARFFDGHIEDVSILEAFARAHEIRDLAGELPTQSVAMLRLLLAILLRATPVEDDPTETWEALWVAESFDLRPIEHYLEKYQNRFDLFDPNQPFYQVTDLATAKGEVTALSRLVADMPAGHQFFTTRAESDVSPLHAAEAARWVVHAQAFDPSGIKSGAVGDDRVKGGRGYPIGVAWCGWLGLIVNEGTSLFHTLLLNLVLTEPGLRDQDDKPAWERGPLSAAVEQGHQWPTGPADLFTWQSRRIRLFHDGSVATAVLLCNGDPLHPVNRHQDEPMTAWRRSDAQAKKHGLPLAYMARKHDPDRAFWRGLGAILNERAEGASVIQPTTWTWLEELRSVGALDQNAQVRAHALGLEYRSNDSVIDELIDDRVVFTIDALTDPAVRTLVVMALSDLDQVSKDVASLERNLSYAGGGDADGSEAREVCYDRAGSVFLPWLRRLNSDSDTDQERVTWQQHLRTLATEQSLALVHAAGEPAWVGRADRRPTSKADFVNSSIAEAWFRRSLRNHLPMAFEPSTAKADAP